MTTFKDVRQFQFEKEDFPEDDPLLRINNDEDAQMYVDELFTICSNQEIIDFAKQYHGSSLRSAQPTSKRQKLRGGTTYLTCDDEEDIRIYKLLQVFDTIHDVCGKNQGEWEYNISPEEVLKYTEVLDIPSQLTSDVLTSEHAIIDFISHRDNLKFGHETVLNPMIGNGIGHFDQTRYKQLSAYLKHMTEDEPEKKSRNRYHIIMYEKEQNRKVSATQILKTLRVMRQWFGIEREIQLDNYQPVTKIFTSLKLLDEQFYKRFTDGSLSLGRFKDQLDITQNLKLWKVLLTDAKSFDGDDHRMGFEYDERPTGWVFRNEIPQNVCLKGFDQNYRVCFEYSGQRATTCMNANEASKLHGTSYLFTPFLANKLKHRKNKKDDVVLAMTTKRCGDWGQVEHCQRYDKIFVTSDRFAALYAYYRKVDFILIQDMRNVQKVGNEKNWAQFTFVMSRGDVHVK